MLLWGFHASRQQRIIDEPGLQLIWGVKAEINLQQDLDTCCAPPGRSIPDLLSRRNIVLSLSRTG